MNTAGSPFAGLNDFEPDKPAETPPPPPASEVRAAASEIGFSQNNFPSRVIPAKRRKGHEEMVNKTYRIRVSDANALQKWMNNAGLTHKDGFALLAQNLPAVKRDR